MQTKVRIWRWESQRYYVVFFGILFFFLGISANAQCAMCRAALESGGDTAQVEAVNDGIVYLMAIPYILVAVVGLLVYRVFRTKKVA
jgi:hypothetical protein